MHITRELNQTRDGGADGSIADVVIEVKRQERTNIPAWLRQVREAAGSENLPILVYRQSREDWKILVDMDMRELADYLQWRASR